MASVMAVAVEPYLRSRLVRILIQDYTWDLINPRAPEKYREALKELIGTRVISRLVEWKITYEWVDEDKREFLNIRIHVKSYLKNLSTKRHKIDGHSWVVASTDTFDSSYEAWELEIPKGSPTSHLYGSNDLVPYITTLEDGTLSLNQGQLCADKKVKSIRSGRSFQTLKETSMTRREHGYLPLVNSFPTVKQKFTLAGGAIHDLDVNLFIGGRYEGSPIVLRTDPNNPHVMSRTYDRLTLPGQSLLLTWKCKTDDQTDREVDTQIENID